jgi:hypothetical protein
MQQRVTAVVFPNVSLQLYFPMCHCSYISPCVTAVIFPHVSLQLHFPMCHCSYIAQCVTAVTFPNVSLQLYFPMCHCSYISQCVTAVIFPNSLKHYGPPKHQVLLLQQNSTQSQKNKLFCYTDTFFKRNGCA